MTKFARNIKPIAHKRLLSQRQSEEHIAQSLPLITTLPAEILNEILGIVLKDSILESIKQQTPILGLRQYRALIRTCKLFKAIVDSACLKLTIQCVDFIEPISAFMFKTTPRIVISPWNDFTATDTQKRGGKFHCQVTSIKRWNSVFKAFQLVSIRHMSSLETATFGRFWRNPYLQLDDFQVLNPDLLHRLRPLFERAKRPPTNLERNRIPLKPQLSYSRGEIVNVITMRNKAIMMHSVRTWKSRNIPLSSLSLSARVKEWWIVEVARGYYIDSYIVGYYENHSLVIDLHCWKYYEPVVSKKPPWR